MRDDRELRLPGLEGEGSIRIDRWGIPHIRAASARDAFFLQGFNAARDRLWQIDLWRKRGLGRLAADFGPGYLMQDRASRLFLYRGPMAREWPNYGPDAEAICTAFASGINAFIALVEAGVQPMPDTFTRFGTRPARWLPEDVVRIRIHCLSRNAGSEFARMQTIRAAGPALDTLRQPLTPPVPPEEFALTPDPSLPPDALAAYELATAPVTFEPERLNAALADAALWSRTAPQGAQPKEGSNNWAVSGRHTTTGRPIMASDPHRAFGTPSLRYLVHLQAPGLSLIGAGEPSSPGIMAGHNGAAAFSLTIFPADQEDLHILDTDGVTVRQHDGQRQPLTAIDETIEVRGQPPQPVTLRFADGAPVVWLDQARGLGLAVRTVFTEPGTAPYMAALAAMRATSPDAFRAALTGWGAPTVNMVYADTQDRIAWQVAGFMPRRNGWRGIVPVPGDGRFTWNGFLTAADLPGETDPARGFVHSANAFNVPDWDHAAAPLGFEWEADGRADRIAEVLGAGPTDVARSCALQTDTLSPLALLLVGCLPGADDPATRMLRGWDGCIDAGSAAALLFETWLSLHLRPALLDRVPAVLRASFAGGDISAVIDLFAGKLPELADSLDLTEASAREAMLTATLQAAWQRVEARDGDPDGWRWGKAHAACFHGAADDAAVAQGLEVGGSGTTVMLTDYDPPSLTPSVGASVRMVVDVGDWDASRWINTPGQSGDASHPHAADLAAIWARGDYVPMLFSNAAVEAATEGVWRLLPG